MVGCPVSDYRLGNTIGINACRGERGVSYAGLAYKGKMTSDTYSESG